MNDVTLVTKTILRPMALHRLLDSVAKYFPKMPVIICDDSPEPYVEMMARNYPKMDIRPIVLPFDSGLSLGRNKAVEQVETQYTLLIDDDHWFERTDDVELLYDVAKNEDVNLASGFFEKGGVVWKGWYGNLFLKDRHLYAVEIPEQQPYFKADVFHNFFVAETEFLRQNPWDNSLKIAAEHIDFCYNIYYNGGNCTVVPDAITKHGPTKDDTKLYDKLRKRKQEHYNLFLRKHNLLAFHSRGTTWRIKW